MRIRATQVFWWCFAGVMGGVLGWESAGFIKRSIAWFFSSDTTMY